MFAAHHEPRQPSAVSLEPRHPTNRWVLKLEDGLLLERVFELERCPGRELRQQLAAYLGVKPRQVQVWFQNKRQRTKIDAPAHASTAAERERQAQRSEMIMNMVRSSDNKPAGAAAASSGLAEAAAAAAANDAADAMACLAAVSELASSAGVPASVRTSSPAEQAHASASPTCLEGPSSFHEGGDQPKRPSPARPPAAKRKAPRLSSPQPPVLATQSLPTPQPQGPLTHLQQRTGLPYMHVPPDAAATASMGADGGTVAGHAVGAASSQFPSEFPEAYTDGVTLWLRGDIYERHRATLAPHLVPAVARPPATHLALSHLGAPALLAPGLGMVAPSSVGQGVVPSPCYGMAQQPAPLQQQQPPQQPISQQQPQETLRVGDYAALSAREVGTSAKPRDGWVASDEPSQGSLFSGSDSGSASLASLARDHSGGGSPHGGSSLRSSDLCAGGLRHGADSNESDSTDERDSTDSNSTADAADGSCNCADPDSSSSNGAGTPPHELLLAGGDERAAEDRRLAGQSLQSLSRRD